MGFLFIVAGSVGTTRGGYNGSSIICNSVVDSVDSVGRVGVGCGEIGRIGCNGVVSGDVVGVGVADIARCNGVVVNCHISRYNAV